MCLPHALDHELQVAENRTPKDEGSGEQIAMGRTRVENN